MKDIRRLRSFPFFRVSSERRSIEIDIQGRPGNGGGAKGTGVWWGDLMRGTPFSIDEDSVLDGSGEPVA